jgi:hypothetical protein
MPTVVDDAIRFVTSNKSKDKLKSSSGNSNEESNEPDYDEDQVHWEEKQEEETGETTIKFFDVCCCYAKTLKTTIQINY